MSHEGGKGIFLFDRKIEFSNDDKMLYPWLKEPNRYYCSIEDRKLAGGRGLVFKTYISDEKGQEINPLWPKIAIKVPNLERAKDFKDNEVGFRAFNQSQDVVREFSLIKQRLKGCDNANPLIDFDASFEDDGRIICRTAQLYVQDGLPLKEWLTQEHLRTQIDEEDDDQKNNWHGINNWHDWRRVSLIIARAISAIHKRRVVHGDVWPDNIWISDANDPYAIGSQKCNTRAILIDFGDAFLTTPYGNNSHHVEKNHAYRAPERGVDLYVPIEQVDVYSFGKVLLYLATGLEKNIPDDRFGRDRRIFVRTEVAERNQSLLKQNPAVVDIIARCTSFDPVTRPKMRDVIKELERGSLSDNVIPIEAPDVSERLSAIRNRLDALFQGTSVRREKMYLRIIDQKIDELDNLVGDHKPGQTPEQIDVGGTREEIIDSITLLFKELGKGDSWTTLTTPEVWQSSALGLDGRYASATIEAIERGASIRRVYAICVEEMGTAWASKLAESLKNNTEHTELQKLGTKLQLCVEIEMQRQIKKHTNIPSLAYMQEYQRRIKDVIDSQRDLIDIYKLKDRIFPSNISDITQIDQLYLAIVPVGTRQEIQSLRVKNPVSLINFSGDPNDGENWMLVMTDIRGRVSRNLDHSARPQLLGYRVHKSVMGYPKDRILEYNRLFADSVNIGPCIKTLAQCIRDAE